MGIELAVGAAIGCAVCNAVAAILQKTSSDKAALIRGYDVGIFVQLVRQWPYAIGLVLDLGAGICTLIAVNKLPLFIVQAIIACCVVLTAFLERIFLHRILRLQTYVAALVVLAGLVCVATAAHGESTATVSAGVKYTLAVLPLLLAIIGAVVVRIRSRAGAFILAGLSGCAFGGDSIIGRIMVYPHPLWLVVENPLLWSLIAYGVIGMFFFTAALQRTLATIVNGLMTSTQTIVPLIVGVALLGDTARNGLWLPVWIGCLLVTAGCFYIAYTD
jgi:drug/metabolite transporter (DMT)-like permease